jgi:hypothetical protein
LWQNYNFTEYYLTIYIFTDVLFRRNPRAFFHLIRAGKIETKKRPPKGTTRILFFKNNASGFQKNS